MEKLTKQELRKPDLFISTVSKAWLSVDKYRTIVLSTFGALVVLGAGYSVYSWVKGNQESKAQTAYYLAKKSLDETQKLYQVDQQAVTEAEKKNVAPPVPKQKSGNLDTDFGSSVAQLEEVLRKQAGTTAAALAALDLADLLEEYKQADRAIENINLGAKGLPQKNMLYGFLMLKKGNLEQAKGSCDQAVQTWSTITATKEFSFLHPDAYLRQGLCYEALSQKPKAIEMYQKVSTDFADTDAGKSAKKYLRLLKNESV